MITCIICKKEINQDFYREATCRWKNIEYFIHNDIKIFSPNNQICKSCEKKIDVEPVADEFKKQGKRNLINKFNETFGNDAHISIKDNSFEITIGTKTMAIEYPNIVGVKSTGSLNS